MKKKCKGCKTTGKYHSKSCPEVKDYAKIWKEMGEPLDFTIEDMRWIDEHI